MAERIPAMPTTASEAAYKLATVFREAVDGWDAVGELVIAWLSATLKTAMDGAPRMRSKDERPPDGAIVAGLFPSANPAVPSVSIERWSKVSQFAPGTVGWVLVWEPPQKAKTLRELIDELPDTPISDPAEIAQYVDQVEDIRRMMRQGKV